MTVLRESLRTSTERKVVTRGEEKMMQRASGTGMKVTLAREQVMLRAPATPEGVN